MSLGTEINNPFDLRDGTIPWRGKIGAREGFCVFDTIDNGLRAGMRDLLIAYREGYNTITRLVSHYAPPSENDTNAYIAGVCADFGMPADMPLSITDQSTLMRLGKAFLRQEQGQVDYSDDQLLNAASEALA